MLYQPKLLRPMGVIATVSASSLRVISMMKIILLTSAGVIAALCVSWLNLLFNYLCLISHCVIFCKQMSCKVGLIFVAMVLALALHLHYLALKLALMGLDFLSFLGIMIVNHSCTPVLHLLWLVGYQSRIDR